MPEFFDAAGKAALGAQAYRSGELENRGRALDNEGQGIRNNAAQEALARAIQEANDDKEMKATWAKALGEILSMRGAQAPSGPDAEVDAFYAAKDDPTQAAIQRVRGMAQRVARTDPQAAQALIEEFGGAIQQRAQEGSLRKVQESASKAITGIQTMAQDGFLPEAAAQQMAAQVQEILETLDENPQVLAQGAAAIQKIRAAATAEYLEAARRADAKAEMQGLVDRLPPSAKRYGALAMAQLANGGDPQKVLASLAERVYGTADPDPEAEFKRPGVFEQSPSWVQARIRGEASEAALTYLSKLKIQDKNEKGIPIGEPRGLTPDEILAALPQWEDRFLQREMARANKTSQPRSGVDALPLTVGGRPVQPQPRPGGAVGAPDAEMQKVLTAPAPVSAVGMKGVPRVAMGQGSRPAQRATTADDKVVRVRDGEREPVSVKGLRKRGKNEAPEAYLDYVKKAVSQRGGTAEDVARALEAAGLTPEDFKQSQPREPVSGFMRGVK